MKSLFADTAQVLFGKLFYAASQLMLLLAMSREFGPTLVGYYALAVAAMAPVAHLVLRDMSTSLLAGQLGTLNLTVVLKLPAIIVVLAVIGGFSWRMYGGAGSTVIPLFLSVLVIKICEGISELEVANAQRNRDFISLRGNLVVRGILIYLFGALLMICDSGYLSSIQFIGATAIISSIFHVKKLARAGFAFSVISGLGVTLRQIQLGFAAAIKTAATGSLRFLSVFIWDTETLGLMTPAFQFLTLLSLIGVVFEKILTPEFLTKAEPAKKNDGRLKSGLFMVGAVYAILVLSSVLLGDVYYSFFYDDNYSAMVILLPLFALGWPLYIARSVLKVLSFHYDKGGHQLWIQTLAIGIVILLVALLYPIFSYASVAFSHIVATAVVAAVYLRLIRFGRSR